MKTFKTRTIHFTFNERKKAREKSILQTLETRKIPCFPNTKELNIDAFSMPPISYRPPAFNNGLSNRNRPISIENGMLRKLAAVSPAPANNIRGYAF